MKKYFQHKLIMLCFGFAVISVNAQEVVELKMPTSNKIIIKLAFRNGSISDPAGKEGITYATAKLMANGGAGKYTDKQITEILYPMAASYSVFTDKEVSIFTFAVHRDFLDKFYAIVKEIVLHPAFGEEDFKRLKSNQQNSVDELIRSSSDEDYSKVLLEDQLFRGGNYQHMTIGTSTGVSSITLDDIRNHYHNYFTRSNLTIGIAGNYSPAFLTLLKKDMASLSAVKPVIPAPSKANIPDGIQVEIISKKDALGSAIFTGASLPITRANDDFAALMVANSYLGEHRKSYGMLYDKIRSTRSMNYGDYSYIEWYQGAGFNMLPATGVPRSSNYFSIWIRPVQTAEGLKQQYAELKDINIGHAQYALRLALREVDMLIKNGMTKIAFENTRRFLRSYNKLYILTLEKQLGFLVDAKFYGRKNYLQDMDALLAKLTVDDVNRAIKKYWQINNMYVSIVTDDSEAEALAKALKENTPSPMSYSNLVKEGLPKAVLTEDDEVAKFPLNIKDVKIIDTKNTLK
ncbi:MAG: pitrilysin family protein [Ferruginibacter sp.]